MSIRCPDSIDTNTRLGRQAIQRPDRITWPVRTQIWLLQGEDSTLVLPSSIVTTVSPRGPCTVIRSLTAESNKYSAEESVIRTMVRPEAPPYTVVDIATTSAAATAIVT